MTNGQGPKPPEFNFDNINWPVNKKYIIPGIGVIILLIIISTSYYTVKANQEGIILRFGAYVETVGPGLHFKIPIADKVLIGEVKRIYNEEFGFRTMTSGRVSSFAYDFPGAQEESLMLTGDLNCAEVHWVIRYKIKNLKNFFFNVRNVKETLRQVSQGVMRRIVGDRSVDEVLTIGRTEIEDVAKTEISKSLDAYGCGISIQAVMLKGVNPPAAVKEAFNAVNQAVQTRDRIINDAEGQKNKILPAALGKKEQVIKEAEGYKIKRINEAQGDTNAFLAILEEYEKAKDVTRRRLYLETMAEILPKCDKVYLFDEEQKGLLPFINLGSESKLLEMERLK
ncbi:MAG: FtsH protease activity modulator HflK [Candidatus Anammoxibacter sp.]